MLINSHIILFESKILKQIFDQCGFTYVYFVFFVFFSCQTFRSWVNQVIEKPLWPPVRTLMPPPPPDTRMKCWDAPFTYVMSRIQSAVLHWDILHNTQPHKHLQTNSKLQSELPQIFCVTDGKTGGGQSSWGGQKQMLVGGCRSWSSDIWWAVADTCLSKGGRQKISRSRWHLAPSFFFLLPRRK